MKKVIILGLLFPLLASASIDTNLKYGSKGSDVSELQEFLIDKGLLVGQATGNFYSLTLKAVKAYQELVSLPNTGYVGPLTRAKINGELDTVLSASKTEEATQPTPQPVVQQQVVTPPPVVSQPLGQVETDPFNMTVSCKFNPDTGKNAVYVDAKPTKGGYGELHIIDTRYSGGPQITPQYHGFLSVGIGTWNWEANLYDNWQYNQANGLIATKTGTITCQ